MLSKQRTTCAIASTSRMCERNLLPSPSPCEAPATRPAISTNSTVVGNELLRVGDRGELLQPRIGHRNHADVGIDRTERVVLGSDLGARERVEQSRLADIRPDLRCRTG